MKAMPTSNVPTSQYRKGRAPRKLGLALAIGMAAASALGAAKQESPRAGLQGVLLVCKDCLTVRGTFLTDVRGRDIARLNFLFGDEVSPRFSPVDDRVLFTSTRGNASGLWTTNRAGKGQNRLCDGDQGDWFPDGRRIVFRRAGQIIVRSLETGQETMASPLGWKSGAWPACSPDGRRIVFVNHDGGAPAICLLTFGETKAQPLAMGEILGAPRWSPKGERIVFQRGPHLWTMDADGSHQRQLTTGGGIQRCPAWSPDGTTIAYSQGPGPRGPWQLAFAGADGTRRQPVSLDDTRAALCADWGVEQPGHQAQRIAPVSPPPRLRAWEIESPITAAPADWLAFCRERKGWRAIATETALPMDARGGVAVESDTDVFLLLAGQAGAILVSKTATRSPTGFGLLDRQGKEAGPVETLRVVHYSPDHVALESSSRPADLPVKARWSLDANPTCVQVTPRSNADKLRIRAPWEAVVAPDRFANDLVVAAGLCSTRPVCLPWTPLLTALLGKGSQMLVVVCPQPGQRAQLQSGKSPLSAHVDVAFQDRAVSAGLIAVEGAWHLEHFGKEGLAERRFDWRMPCPAAWRLAVQGEGCCYSSFFSDKESALFDGKSVHFRKSGDIPSGARMGMVYLHGRTAKTPPQTLTPVDFARNVLGIEGTERAFDEAGLTGYRRAGQPTTWADVSVTLDSLRYLFERQLEVQDAGYARHLCADIPLFVEGMDQRLEEYVDFARDLASLAGESGAKFRDDLAPFLRKLGEIDSQRRGLKSARELLPHCEKIVRLTGQESVENQKQFGQCCKAILQVVGPREEMLKACRKAAVGACDAAGTAALAGADLVKASEKIRSRCQRVLRNRFYVEGDWRGEDYAVPAFWLGPRPYQ